MERVVRVTFGKLADHIKDVIDSVEEGSWPDGALSSTGMTLEASLWACLHELERLLAEEGETK